MKSDLLALYVISAIWSDNMTFALEPTHQGVYKLFLVLDNFAITKGCVNHGFDIVLLVVLPSDSYIFRSKRKQNHQE